MPPDGHRRGDARRVELPRPARRGSPRRLGGRVHLLRHGRGGYVGADSPGCRRPGALGGCFRAASRAAHRDGRRAAAAAVDVATALPATRLAPDLIVPRSSRPGSFRPQRQRTACRRAPMIGAPRTTGAGSLRRRSLAPAKLQRPRGRASAAGSGRTAHAPRNRRTVRTITCTHQPLGESPVSRPVWPPQAWSRRSPPPSRRLRTTRPTSTPSRRSCGPTWTPRSNATRRSARRMRSTKPPGNGCPRSPRCPIRSSASRRRCAAWRPGSDRSSTASR